MGSYCLSHILTFALVAALSVFSSLINVAHAQAVNATIDPSEARALDAVFRRWGLWVYPTQWNISTQICSGSFLDDNITIDDNPFIKCDCSYNNKTTCHITALKVYALNVTDEIPEELWTLTYLTNLNLAQNCFTGSLSPAIANLTRLQYLTFGINNLSGKLPKELGSLTELISFYIGSSGISGPIPSTFANLKNLVTVWASDVELTGRIPDFIGNWSRLQALRFQGNSFNGSIPSSFSNLTSLAELRISDLSNGNSTLEFVRNMKSLTILELRNNNISGSIPSVFGEFHNLKQLDLSFNNITGQIPEFLGNNKLSGALPTQKRSSILNM